MENGTLVTLCLEMAKCYCADEQALQEAQALLAFIKQRPAYRMKDSLCLPAKPESG
jgi:hypothetical protein